MRACYLINFAKPKKLDPQFLGDAEEPIPETPGISDQDDPPTNLSTVSGETSKLTPSAQTIRVIAEKAGLQNTAFWHARVAQVLMAKGHYDDALEEFRLSMDQDSIYLWLSHQGIAGAYAMKGLLESAISHMETSFHLYNTGRQSQTGDLFDLAQWQVDTGHIDKAVSSAKRALQCADHGCYYLGVTIISKLWLSTVNIQYSSTTSRT